MALNSVVAPFDLPETACVTEEKNCHPTLFNHVLFYGSAVETVLREEHQFQGGPLKICRYAEKRAPNKDGVS